MKKIRFEEDNPCYNGKCFNIIGETEINWEFSVDKGVIGECLKSNSVLKYEIIEDNVITGKEALIAFANGEEVQVLFKDGWTTIGKYNTLGVFDLQLSFRLKPRTITLNGMGIPAPFEPKRGDIYWYIQLCSSGYSGSVFVSEECDKNLIQFGAWRSEDEIKQVVAALRSIFATA